MNSLIPHQLLSVLLTAASDRLKWISEDDFPRRDIDKIVVLEGIASLSILKSVVTTSSHPKPVVNGFSWTFDLPPNEKCLSEYAHDNKKKADFRRDIHDRYQQQLDILKALEPHHLDKRLILTDLDFDAHIGVGPIAPGELGAHYQVIYRLGFLWRISAEEYIIAICSQGHGGCDIGVALALALEYLRIEHGEDAARELIVAFNEYPLKERKKVIFCEPTWEDSSLLRDAVKYHASARIAP